MGSRSHGIVRRAKKPKHAPLVGSDFNKKFAAFAARKGMATSAQRPKSHFGKIKRP